MLRKLMVRTWFGELPAWTEKFVEHIKYLEQYGWFFLLINDYDWYAYEVSLQLGVDVPPESKIDRRKCGDWDPYLGAILQKHLKTQNFDYWAHVNLDAVYGRIDRWLPDSFLQNIDIFGNDPGAICGPFSVYRNTPKINNLFRGVYNWRHNLESKTFCGWDETNFSDHVRQMSLTGNINFASGFFTAHDHMTVPHKERQEVEIKDDGTLIDSVTGREIMCYHFNQTRRWPVK